MSFTGDNTAPGRALPSRPMQPRAVQAPLGRPHGQSGPVPDPDLGYRGPTACSAAGITYRQLDYWARTGLVEPSIRPAGAASAQRLYGFGDILVLKIVKRLLDAGVSLQNIRVAADHLRGRRVGDLVGVTLMSDGASVYECTSYEEVVELVQGGQGVFGIAVGAVCREVEAALGQLQGEVPDTGETIMRFHPSDELAARRRNKAV